MPCEPTLANDVQPGLEFRNHSFVRRPDSAVLPRRGPRWILAGTPMRRLLRALMDLGKLSYSDEIVGRGVEHAKKLGARILEATQFKESATERNPRRQIRRMLGEAGLADSDSLFAVARPPVLLCKLRKSNRRRILLDPASKVPDSRVIRHALDYCPSAGNCPQGISSSSSSSALTSTDLAVVLTVPVMSVTVKTTA